MARAVEQWMPMYWGDYLKKTARFTLAHHGAYMLLIAEYWSSGKPLPADPEEQALIVHIPVKDWLKLRLKIGEKFDEKDGLWHHERVDFELSKAEANHKAKAKAGAEGAAKRWQKDSKIIAEPSSSQSQTDAPLPSPIPSPIGEKEISDDDRFGKIFDEELWPIRPSRGQASNDKKPARIKFIRLCKRGEDPQAIIAGLKAYASNPTTKLGTEYVKTVETWLSKESWKDQPPPVQHFEVAAIGTPRSTHLARYRGWYERGFWPPLAGPKPPKPGFAGEPGYDVPRDVIEEIERDCMPAHMDARPKRPEAAE